MTWLGRPHIGLVELMSDGDREVRAVFRDKHGGGPRRPPVPHLELLQLQLANARHRASAAQRSIARLESKLPMPSPSNSSPLRPAGRTWWRAPFTHLGRSLVAIVAPYSQVAPSVRVEIYAVGDDGLEMFLGHAPAGSGTYRAAIDALRAVGQPGQIILPAAAEARS